MEALLLWLSPSLLVRCSQRNWGIGAIIDSIINVSWEEIKCMIKYFGLVNEVKCDKRKVLWNFTSGSWQNNKNWTGNRQYNRTLLSQTNWEESWSNLTVSQASDFLHQITQRNINVKWNLSKKCNIHLNKHLHCIAIILQLYQCHGKYLQWKWSCIQGYSACTSNKINIFALQL